MECNKDEAIRAREIAENKMQNSDFIGARKIALKAQQLYPELENISQLLTVCEVHCSAENKLNGSEMDWYGVLQIERFADVGVIKKQYRKLALSLHPDKNKFAGAEAAFKLIGEANRVLTDPAKRNMYDMKCKALMVTAAKMPAPHQSHSNSHYKKQQETVTKFPHAPHPQYVSSHARPTFWTCCSACGLRLQYYRDFLNKMLRCHSCKKNFLAHDLGGGHGMPPGPSWSQFPNQQGIPNQRPLSNAVPKSFDGKFAGVKVGFDPIPTASKTAYSKSDDRKPAGVKVGLDPMPKAGKFTGSVPKAGESAFSGRNTEPKESKAGNHPEIGKSFKPREEANGHVNVGAGNEGVKSNCDVRKAKETGPKKRVTGTKRGRKSKEHSSESVNISSSDEDEENVITQKNGSSRSAGEPRRSSRQKQSISYKENISDDDKGLASSSKRPRTNGSSSAADVEMGEHGLNGGIFKEDAAAGSAAAAHGSRNGVKQKVTSSLESGSSKKKRTQDYQEKGDDTSVSEEARVELDKHDGKSGVDDKCGAEVYVYPDADFYNFDNDKSLSCFAIGQLWAVYDPVDGMPRFYVLIRRVFASAGKMQIRWLEACSDDKNEQDWLREDLPVGCGKFEIGSNQVIEISMFSHQMLMRVPFSRKGPYVIYPKKGETWALFRDWDIKWSSEPEKHKPPYQFEFVEVVSDFTENHGIGVAYLGKVNGFVSIFQPTVRYNVVSCCIPPAELYRFSHQVPSRKLTGQEGEGVPANAFELDPASLPSYLFNSHDPCDAKQVKGNLDSEAINSFPESPKTKVNLMKGSEKVCTPKKNENGFARRAVVLGVSAKDSSETVKKGEDWGELFRARRHVKGEDGNQETSHGNASQPEIRASCTPRKQHKNELGPEAFIPRRSPRDVSKSNSEVNGSQFATTTTNKVNSDASSSGSGNKIHVMGAKSACLPESSLPSGPRVVQVRPYDFKSEKSRYNFQLKQIWALHSDGDQLPRDYARIEKIQRRPVFRLHVVMLDPVIWHPKDTRPPPPVCCGSFKAGKQVDGMAALPVAKFSHQLVAQESSRNEYQIYPRKGEIWVVHRKRNTESPCWYQDFVEFDIVEVLEGYSHCATVVALQVVNRSASVYRTPRRSKTNVTEEIPREEFARFSHRCCAIQVVSEESPVKGCWQVDPLSIPATVIIVD